MNTDNSTFYLHNGKEKTGPFTIDELKKMPLTKETFVWSEGFADWKKITDVPELKDILGFPQTPPPFKKSNKLNTFFTVVKWLFLITIGTFFVFYLIKLGVEVANKISSKKNELTYNQPTQYPETIPVLTEWQKEELIQDDECVNPEKYITINFSYRDAIFGGNIKLSGTLTNHASLTSYDKIELEIEYLNAEKLTNGTDIYIVNGDLDKHKSLSFSSKFNSPSNTSSIRIRIKGVQCFK